MQPSCNRRAIDAQRAQPPPDAHRTSEDALIYWGSGRLAQRERASFTPKRSLVRSQYRPPARRRRLPDRSRRLLSLSDYAITDRREARVLRGRRPRCGSFDAVTLAGLARRRGRHAGGVRPGGPCRRCAPRRPRCCGTRMRRPGRPFAVTAPADRRRISSRIRPATRKRHARARRSTP